LTVDVIFPDETRVIASSIDERDEQLRGRGSSQIRVAFSTSTPSPLFARGGRTIVGGERDTRSRALGRVVRHN
jgi:hypothetical protein